MDMNGVKENLSPFASIFTKLVGKVSPLRTTQNNNIIIEKQNHTADKDAAITKLNEQVTRLTTENKDLKQKIAAWSTKQDKVQELTMLLKETIARNEHLQVEMAKNDSNGFRELKKQLDASTNLNVKLQQEVRELKAKISKLSTDQSIKIESAETAASASGIQVIEDIECDDSAYSCPDQSLSVSKQNEPKSKAVSRTKNAELDIYQLVENVRNLIDRLGLTHADLARRLHLSKQYTSRLLFKPQPWYALSEERRCQYHRILTFYTQNEKRTKPIKEKRRTYDRRALIKQSSLNTAQVSLDIVAFVEKHKIPVNLFAHYQLHIPVIFYEKLVNEPKQWEELHESEQDLYAQMHVWTKAKPVQIAELKRKLQSKQAKSLQNSRQR